MLTCPEAISGLSINDEWTEALDFLEFTPIILLEADKRGFTSKIRKFESIWTLFFIFIFRFHFCENNFLLLQIFDGFKVIWLFLFENLLNSGIIKLFS